MRWSRKLGEVAGIGIYVHWSFLILIGWIAFMILSRGGSPAAAVEGIFFVLAVFGCVVLHELGHALMARRYGVRTRDITLLPIGGVARLERMPRDPRQEFLVAVAGPAVNVAIAIVLFFPSFLLLGLGAMGGAEIFGTNFLVSLMKVNILLVLFNLLPAFPMDGGRILRALLAMILPYSRATQIAARIGQVLAVFLAIAGLLLLHNPFLVFIAFFVFLGAQQEARMVRMQGLVREATVSHAMLRRFRALETSDSLDDAMQELIAGRQQDFPVLRNDRIVGMLTRRDLLEALAHGSGGTLIGKIMRPTSSPVGENDSLRLTFQRMMATNCSMLPVERAGHLVGIVTLRDIREWLGLRSPLLGPRP